MNSSDWVPLHEPKPNHKASDKENEINKSMVLQRDSLEMVGGDTK